MGMEYGKDIIKMNIWENGFRISPKGLASTFGQIVMFMRANGRRVLGMVRDRTHLILETNMLESISGERQKASVNTNGTMATHTQDSSRTA